MLSLVFGLLGLIIFIWFLVTIQVINQTTRRTEVALKEILNLLRDKIPPED